MYSLLETKVPVVVQKVLLFCGFKNPMDNECDFKMWNMKNG